MTDSRRPSRRRKTGSRVPPPSRHGPSCSSTAGSRRRRPGRTFDDIAGRDGSARSPRSPRAAPRTSTALSPPPARSFDDRRWTRPVAGEPQAGPAPRSPSSIRDEPRRARAARVARRRQADPRHARGRRPERARRRSSGTPRRSTRSTARSARPGPDDAVARHPRADRRRRRDRALELPADHHRLEARRRRSRPATRSCSSRPRQSPLTALRLAELAAEAGLPDGVLNVVTGPGARRSATRSRATPASTRSRSPARPRSGRRSSRAVGETDVKAISLELGGKSPQVVLADVGDLEAAASAHRLGIFYNSGQTCNAGSRLVVHRSVREELVERDRARWARELAPGEPLDPRPGSGSIVDERQLDEGPRLRRPRARGRRPGRRPAASGSARRPAATTSRRRSSTASATRCASPARRSSGRS